MKRVRLKHKPSFYEDLTFSHWLMKDRVLAVVLDRQNRVEELRMDPREYKAVIRDLRLMSYL